MKPIADPFPTSPVPHPYADHTIHTQFFRDLVRGTSVVSIFVYVCKECGVYEFRPQGACTLLPCLGHAKFVEHPGTWDGKTKFEDPS